MASPVVDPATSSSYCSRCGGILNAVDKFCTKCGAPVSSGTPTGPRVVNSKSQDFERHLRVAWSCLKDVENKIDEIRSAKDAGDKEVNEGTFRGTIAMSALQGKLEREFHENLDMAWKQAMKALEIDASGSVEINGVVVTPEIVFGGVCGLRGDLQFAFDKWDDAIALYNQVLQHIPDAAACYYNIGAAYTNKHDPTLAMAAFQKVVELDPTGYYGVEATKNLEKLKVGAIGKKGFAGSWIVVAVLGVLTLGSLVTMGQQPVAGLFGILLWGVIMALYCWRKYK